MRRLLHAALVAAVAVAALSLVDALGLASWHRPAGYVALVVVALRVGWGAMRGHRWRGRMALLRVAFITALAASGWLYATDAFWGSEGVEDAHRMLAWALLALVAAHLASVIRARLRRLRTRATHTQ